jgi:hypothetical protein
LTEVLEKVSQFLKDFLTNCDSVSWDEIKELKDFISEQCLKARYINNERNGTNRAKTSPEKCKIESNILIFDQITEFRIPEKWKEEMEEWNAHLFHFSGNDGYAEIEVIINSDKTWIIIINKISD